MNRHIIPSLICAVGLLISLSACSKEQDSNGRITISESAFDISVQQADPQVTLDYACYAFRSDDGSQYILYDIIDPLTSGNELPWTPNEIYGYKFRFLFLALPESSAPLAVVANSDQPVLAGTAWEDISIKAQALELPLHCYYGITNIDGSDMIAAQSVSCTLKRIVGQMAFDFYKVDASGSGRTPINIDGDKAVTVMDRVRSVELTYTGLSDRLVFDNSYELIPVASAGRDTTLFITTELSDTLSLSLPQPDNSLLIAYDGAPGGAVRLNGFYMLPSEKVKVKMELNYYDTTPTCGTKGHLHEAGCFDGTRIITLNIPAEDKNSSLTVLANSLTRNKAMIRCDRVIDIPVSSGIGFDVEWGAKEQGN